MSEMPSPFVAGFAARHDAAAAVLVGAFPVEGFAPAPVRPRGAEAPRPRHFSPADRAGNPTAGWNPLDPEVQETRLDPLEAAHAAGYAEGLAAAAAAARAGHDRDAGLLDGIAAGLADAGRIDREGLARRLRDTVLALVTRLVGDAGVSGDLLARRVGAAADLLADKAEAALLRVHPDDVALLDGRLPPSLFAAGDPSVERGGFVLESASTVLEDGPSLWLDDLAAAIERVPLPPQAPPC